MTRAFSFVNGATAIAVSIVAVAASGCATTRIHSQVDSQIRGQSYGKLMVVVDFRDLGLRQDAESQFQESLRSRGTDAVRSVDLLFPGRTYSTDEVERILRNAGIQAILVASNVDSGTRSTWMPQTKTSEGTATVIGNSVSARSTTTTAGGFYVDKPWAQFEARLHDASSGAVVWIASMSSGGNAFAGWDDLARSMAKKASEQLHKDGVIK